MRKRTLLFIELLIISTGSWGITDNLSYSKEPLCVKSGTPHILETIFLGTAKTTLRPEMETSSASEHFRVHYDTSGYNAPPKTDAGGNGIPDYIDSTLVYLEYVWDLEINQLGYKVPLSDNGAGGDNKIDVYIREMNNVYGQTMPDDSFQSATSSYIEIDNDFSNAVYATKGYDALRVTTAHEFFHTIHFSYYYNMDLIWWMEHSAVWMEDRAWDDVNDYLAYLFLFFDNNQTPLNSTQTFMYGAAIWAHYLAKSFGDDIIKKIWEHVSELQRTDIAAFDAVIPIGLSNALRQFAVWNFFTNDRANPIDFYKDSNLFTQTVSSDLIIDTNPTSNSMSIRNLTSRYVEALFVGNWGSRDAIRVKVTPKDNGTYVSSLILYNSPFDFKVHIIDSKGTDVPLEKKWTKAMLVVSSTSTRNKSYEFDFSMEILEGVIFVEEDIHPSPFILRGTYPNPFNPATTISFVMHSPGDVSISIFNTIGQKVEEVFSGHLDTGGKCILWKPSDLSGGVYIMSISTPWGTKTAKILYLK